jgi:hypothetical protein
VPVYEYRCPKCRRKSSVLFRTYAEVTEPACSTCHVPLTKLMSLFSTVKSEDTRAEELSDPSSFGDVDEDDPRSVARWARKMSSEAGEDLGPEFDEMVDAMERGEDPASFGEGVGEEDGGSDFAGGGDDLDD